MANFTVEGPAQPFFSQCFKSMQPFTWSNEILSLTDDRITTENPTFYVQNICTLCPLFLPVFNPFLSRDLAPSLMSVVLCGSELSRRWSVSVPQWLQSWSLRGESGTNGLKQQLIGQWKRVLPSCWLALVTRGAGAPCARVNSQAGRWFVLMIVLNLLDGK